MSHMQMSFYVLMETQTQEVTLGTTTWGQGSGSDHMLMGMSE